MPDQIGNPRTDPGEPGQISRRRHEAEEDRALPIERQAGAGQEIDASHHRRQIRGQGVSTDRVGRPERFRRQALRQFSGLEPDGRERRRITPADRQRRLRVRR